MMIDLAINHATWNAFKFIPIWQIVLSDYQENFEQNRWKPKNQGHSRPTAKNNAKANVVNVTASQPQTISPSKHDPTITSSKKDTNETENKLRTWITNIITERGKAHIASALYFFTAASCSLKTFNLSIIESVSSFMISILINLLASWITVIHTPPGYIKSLFSSRYQCIQPSLFIEHSNNNLKQIK